MRLPWNRKYMEIGFHVILTVLLLVGMIALLLRRSVAKNVILQTAGTFLAVFAPVFWAFFFTLLLEPLTAFWQRFYEKRCTLYHRSRIRNRKAGATLTYLSIGLILFLIGGFLARKIGQTNLSALTEQIGDYIRQAGDMLVLLNLKLAEMGILRNAEWIFSRWIEQATRWMQERMLWLADVIPNIGGSLLDVLLGAVVAFYLLMEKEKIRGIAGELSRVLLGEKITKHAKNLFHEVYTVFAGYLSGQLLDASVMAVLFSAAFTIVGLPHGILIGLVSGFSNLIPYFGAVMAFFLAVLAGLFSGVPMKAVYASVLILLLQQVDSIFIVPKAVGQKLELHPVLVLLSLAAFGRMFGFWGLVFAVPLGALCKNFVLWCYRRKKSDICQ